MHWLTMTNSLAVSQALSLAKKADWWKLLQPMIGWWQVLAAGACLVVLVWGIFRLMSRANEDVDPAEADREMLEAINELRREGDLSESEFRTIKGQLVARLNGQWTSTPDSRKAAASAGSPDKSQPQSPAAAEGSEPKADSNESVQPEQTE
ncbi:MAG: hypothetical protein JNM43_09030 [Planctomycetaceae bacterium]|nr:hypothetical protein [Planctomycetaceae bacterium]